MCRIEGNERMKAYCEMTREELLAEKAQLEKEFEALKAAGISLDMSRGKPAAAQLALSDDMMDVLSSESDFKAEDGT